MRVQQSTGSFALCVDDGGLEDLEVRKLYQVLADREAAREGYIRVVVLDVVDGRVVPNSTVTISGDTISRVAQTDTIPADAQVIDGQGKFLIPGLWDMHAHIQGSEHGWLPLYVANGVTGIRDMAPTWISSWRCALPYRPAESLALELLPQDPFSMMHRVVGRTGSASRLLRRAGPRYSS